MGREELIIEEKLRKLKDIKSQGTNPYPSKSRVDSKSADLHDKYKALKPGEKKKDLVAVGGRVLNVRDFGKIAFFLLRDPYGDIQIVLQEGETPEKSKEFFKKYIDAGDIVQIEGVMFRTQKGELSVLAKKIHLLSKSLLPLPEKWHGIKDDEEKLRKRYLDILLNPEVKEMFVRKSKFWQSVRSFLLDKGFLEVETPVLETSAGGAAATPFKTHHNALDLDVYLRISMGELWQKKLMVAGFPKTFEIGRQFRNEGMDAEHLQDYTQMEFYWGYANFEDGMGLVKELYTAIAKEVYKTSTFQRNGHKFDLADKWKIVNFSEEIKKQTSLDIWKASKLDLEKKLKELKEEFPRGAEKARLIDLLWKHCRRKISGPAFLTGQPVFLTPLAKRSAEDDRVVEQFQVILAGSEVGNGYSELNDPLDQESRFIEQRKLKESGDKEAHEHDESFVEALKYGMPPTCGFGFSERLFAFFEGKPIRETVIFPLMKPLKTSDNKK